MQTHTPIDMFTPAQTCELLSLEEHQVVDMVNSGRLAAYNLAGVIRFKRTDVLAASTALVAA